MLAAAKSAKKAKATNTGKGIGKPKRNVSPHAEAKHQKPEK